MKSIKNVGYVLTGLVALVLVAVFGPFVVGYRFLRDTALPYLRVIGLRVIHAEAGK